ncbi:MAG: hypothetical protein ABWY25_09760 [Paenisporosarcina sp.]
MILFIFLPGITHQGAKLGLDVFIHRLLPYLLPYLVVSQWLLYVLYKQNAWQPSFINNLKIYGIGAFGGFPTGAATISTLVKANMLSTKTASHLIGICHAPSPMFVMGVVGTQFLSSPKKGLLILVLIHLINAVFLLFSQRLFSRQPRMDKVNLKAVQSPFSEGIQQTSSILLLVATTVVFFTTVSTVISNLMNHFSANMSSQLVVLIYSFFEMTAGLEIAHRLFASESFFSILAVAILSFNGVSIHMQVIVLAKSASLSLKPYVAYRFLHFIILTLIWFLFFQ